MAFDETEYAGRSFEPAVWKRLFPFLRPFGPLLLVVLALNVVCALVDIVLPLL